MVDSNANNNNNNNNNNNPTSEEAPRNPGDAAAAASSSPASTTTTTTTIALARDDPFLSESEDGYVELQLSRECSIYAAAAAAAADRRGSSAPWIAAARPAIISWILQCAAYFAFGPRTAFAAAAYFDRFLRQENIDERPQWALDLLKVACVSLAAKMEERSPTPLPAIARRDEHQFGSAAVQRMELFVLRVLRWRMCSVTPFSFLCYFAHKFFDKGYVSDHLLLRAAQFIFVTIKVMNLAVTAASSIAAAAVFAAADSSLTRDLIESKVTSIVDSLPEPLDPEGVFSCYSVMIQGACKEEPKLSKESLSNPLEANHANNDDYSVANKRRKLE